MKAISLRAMSILALVMALAAVSVHAQSSVNTQKFTVPFKFNVGNEVLPAGEYRVTVENQTIRLAKSDGSASVIALSQRSVHASKVSSSVKLTFRQRGDQIYLSQVWLTDGLGRELKKPRIENSDLAQSFSVIEVPADAR